MMSCPDAAELPLRDHGGNLNEARAKFGGSAETWIDLSTGINRVPWPIGDISQAAWTTLPATDAYHKLIRAAAFAYDTDNSILPLAGAQAAIQLLPSGLAKGTAAILGPTYNEYAASFSNSGWEVRNVTTPEALRGADVAVVVNPNNPTGRVLTASELTEIATQVGTLVIDQSFADADPTAGHDIPDASNTIALRSFGKFYGLAGVRLGFMIGPAKVLRPFGELAGPWAVSGPAQEIGIAALRDTEWKRSAIERLSHETVRLDMIASKAGWRLVGGTSLFRLYETPDALAAQNRLARGHIWSRRFPWSQTWLRLGLPGTDGEWDQLAAAAGQTSSEI